MRKHTLLLLSSTLLLGSLTGLVSCSENSVNSTISGNVETIHVESVSLTSSVTSLEVGKTLTLQTKILPSDANNQNVVYSSSNKEIATVNTSGVVTGVKSGNVTITVRTEDGNKESSISLQVIEAGYKYVNANEMGEELAGTPYKNKIIGGDKYGLSSPDQVGVDVAEKGNVLYAPKEDAQFDKILETSSLTLSQIKEVIPETSEVNGYTSIQGAILIAKKYVEEGKSVKIKLPSGKLDIDASNVSSDRVFVLDGLKNVALEGNNTIINLQISGLSYKGYLTITNCENLTLFGIRFRQEVGANVTGVIESYDVENYSVTLKVDSAYNETMKRVVATNKRLRSYLEFHKGTKAPIQGGNFFVDSFTSTNIQENNGEYTVTIRFNKTINESQIGTLASLQFAQYDVSGISVGDSKNVYLESLTMNKAYGMGLTANNIENFYINRFNLVVEDGNKDLMTSCADATHFSYMTGEVKFTNSIIEYSHDDALNIKHGYWYKLDNASSQNKTMTLSKITSAMPLPKAGDKIAVYNQTTFQGHGTYTVASATEESGKMVLTVKERISGYSSWGDCRVTFLSNTPTFEFKNNIVRNKRNRGILVQVPNAIIENNTFMNVGHGSIQAASAMDQFNEATLPQGLTIKNNKFINNNYLKEGTLYGDISIFAISNNASVAPAGTLSNFTLENNFFSQNGNACVSLRGVGSSVIKDCFFYDASSSQPSGDAYNCLFSMYNTDNITIEGSYNQYNLNNGLSGIIPQGSTSDENTILADNKNISFQVIDDVGPEVDIQKATGVITLDGKLDEWNSIGATDIEIRGYTDALGGEWSAKQLEDTFKVNSLKMTYDDTGIYVGFDVFDDIIDCKTINDFWLGDCVEILASTITNKPNADLSVYKEEGGVLQTAFAPTWSSNGFGTIASVRTNSSIYNNRTQLQAKMTTTSTGYSGEVLFPFTMIPEFKTAIDEGKRIDMAIIVADAERPSRKRIQASNVPHNVENNKTMTARMPQYLFK